MDTLSRSIMPHEDRRRSSNWSLFGYWRHRWSCEEFQCSPQANGFKRPIYDVMSAYPYFGQGNIQSKKIKMAIIHNKNTHYRWYNILGVIG